MGGRRYLLWILAGASFFSCKETILETLQYQKEEVSPTPTTLQGEIDTSWGENGSFSAFWGNENEICMSLNDMAIGEDGSIYAGGSFTFHSNASEICPTTDLNATLLKILPDGKGYDTSFGSSGRIEFGGNATNSRDTISDIEIFNNKLYIAGEIIQDEGGTPIKYLFVGRLDLNGNWDSSFGGNCLPEIAGAVSPKGCFVFKQSLFGFSDHSAYPLITRIGYALRIDANGKIYLMGSLRKPLSDVEAFLVRLKPDGSGLDTTFNGTGYIYEDEDFFQDLNNLVYGRGFILKEDKIFLLIQFPEGLSQRTAVLGFYSNGTYNLSFGVNGTVKIRDFLVTPSDHDLLVNTIFPLSDGFLLGGNADNNSTNSTYVPTGAVGKFTYDTGGRASSFGSSGSIKIDNPLGINSTFEVIYRVLLFQGRVYFIGTYSYASKGHIMLGAIDPSTGELEGSFGNSGYMIFSPDTPENFSSPTPIASYKNYLYVAYRRLFDTDGDTTTFERSYGKIVRIK